MASPTRSQSKLKIGVLISGRGTNLQSLIDRAASDPAWPVEIALVFSNKADAKGLDRAAEAGIPTKVLSHKDFDERADFDAEVTKILDDEGIQLVVLAGYMRILSEEFVKQWRDRLINIHPALLPSFKGLHVQERALDTGVRITGATVHFVRLGTDEGPIIIQGALPVQPDDTPETLEARTLKIEHQILPEAVTLIAEGRVRVVSEKVEIENRGPEPETAIIVPAINRQG